MATQKLSKTIVSAAPKAATRYTLFDSVVPGFGLRVSPTGEKSWIFEYRPGEGGRSTLKKRVTIGKERDFTVDAARKEADKLRTIVKSGGDPQGEKASQRDAPTLTAVAAAFMRQHIEKKRGEATQTFYRSMLDRIILPKLGGKKAKDVTGRMVSALHQEWADTPYQANRILAVVGSMYGWATGPVGLLPEGLNPARGIERFSEEKRGQVLSTEALERLGASIREAETTGLPWQLNPDANVKHRPKDTPHLTVIGEHAAAALRLLIFTGARLREILHLRWDQVDFEQGLLILPKHKTSRKTGVKAIVLNAPALEVLANLSRVGVYVICRQQRWRKGREATIRP